MKRINHLCRLWLALLSLLVLGAPKLSAADLWWDPVPGTPGPGDGSGQWSNLGSLANWWDGNVNVAWNPSDTAVIGFNTATAGTITITNKILVGGIVFSNLGSAGYTIAAASLTSVPLANATNILFTGLSPAIIIAGHNVTNGQIGEAISASVVATNGLSVMANNTATNSLFQFRNFTNSIHGNLYAGTPGNATYGGTTALFCDMNTPTTGDPYVAIANNLTNVTVYSNATFRISNHNTGTRSTIQWPKQITISGDGRNANIGAWIITGNVGDNYVANVTLAGDSTIDFNAGPATSQTFGMYGAISGAGRLQLVCGNARKHTLELTNASTYVGDTIIAGGLTARLINGNDRLPTGTVLTLGTTTSPNVEWNKLGRLTLGNASLAVNQTIAGLQTAGVADCVVAGGNTLSTSVLTVNNGSDYVYAGTLGGTVAPANMLALLKIGVGKLSLQGTNLCSGGYTVNGGTLEFGDGGTDYPLSGAIANNAAVVFNAAGALSHGQAISGTGSVTKQGFGTLTLNGTNSYTGATTVAGGTLILSTSKSGTGAISVGTGLELDLKRHAAKGKITATSASFDSDTVRLDFGLKGPNATPMLDVTGTLANTGTMNIYIQNAGTLTIGTYPLIKYGSFSDGGGSAFNLAVPISPRVTATIVNNTGTKTIELVVTAVDLLKWTGSTDNVWDTTTTNWLLTGSASPINYADGELLQLDDTGLNTAITLGISVAPGMMMLSNTSTPYSISGPGSISGDGTLVKNGSGSLTLATAGGVSHSGGTIIQAGTLTVGDGSVDCGIAAPVENNGLLVVDVASANNLPAISGTGSLTKQGAGELTLDDASTYGGATTISAGIVHLANSDAFGTAASGTTLSSGAEMHLVAGGLAVPEPLNIAGTGTAGAGALQVDNGASTWSGSVTATADTMMAATFNTSLTLGGAVNGGNHTLEFRPVNTSYFTASSNLSAGTVLLNEAGGLFLNAASPTLTNVVLAKANPTSGSISATAGITANDSLALGTNGMVRIINSNLIGNSGAILRLGNNASIPSGVGLDVTIPDDGDAGPGQYRATFGTLGATSTNSWNGPITVHGGASGGVATLLIVRPENTSRLVLNGNITLADGDATLFIRGNGHTVFNGQINWGTNTVGMTADGNVDATINSTGNTWGLLSIGGTAPDIMHLGVNNAMPTSAPVEFTAAGAMLDMNGFNQQIGGLYGTAGTVRNNSTNTDSTLLVSSALGSNWLFAGAIAHLPAAKSLNLDVADDTLTLSGAGNNYTGGTTIRSGATLALLTSGNITASPVIDVQSGGTFDVTGRTSGDYTLPAVTTLKGNGTINGSIVNSVGTVSPGASIGLLTVNNNVTFDGTGIAWMEVNNAAATNDRLNAGGLLTYGGTLVITNISATPYTNNQVIKLFDATGGYTGAFANIVFPGIIYDASQLTVDGTIKVVSAVSTTPTSVTFFPTAGGTALDLSWPADHTGWRLQSQTNSLSTGITTTWHNVPGSTGTNHMIIPVAPGNPTVFFRLTYP